MKLKILLLYVLTSLFLYPENKEFIQIFCARQNHPFNYNLDLKLIPAQQKTDQYMICFHGSGANNKIADTLKTYNVIPDNVVSFNFPDYDNDKLEDDPTVSTFGTIQELLPSLYVLKNVIIDGELRSINLYGFSAGGGVIVNILAILSGTRFESELLNIGITKGNKEQILTALQNGLIILDCPLKSMDEILEFRGGKNAQFDYILQTYAQRYSQNNLRPIDSIAHWNNLNLNILLYFEVPDEKLSNRDDELYVNAMREHNHGITHVVFDCNGGHCKKHEKLWEVYSNLIN